MTWYGFALISALFSAAAAVFEKKTLFKEEALDFATLLALFNVVVSLPLIGFINFAHITTPSLLVLYGKTILGMFSFLLVMKGLKNLEISGALPLLVLTPGLVALFAYLILGESLTMLQIVGLIGLLIGTYILQVHHHDDLLAPFKFLVKSKGHRYILGALAIFTTTSILDKIILKNYKLAPNSFILFQHIFLAVNFLLFYWIKGRNSAQLKTVFRNSWKPILWVSLFTIIYRMSQIEAVKIGSVALVLALKRVSVFIAVVFGGKLFKDHYLTRKTIATLIMLAGAALVILKLS